ncbi:hypothetical protein AAMO2058_000819500 [Amorphochlora amoebiformis]
MAGLALHRPPRRREDVCTLALKRNKGFLGLSILVLIGAIVLRQSSLQEQTLQLIGTHEPSVESPKIGTFRRLCSGFLTKWTLPFSTADSLPTSDNFSPSGSQKRVRQVENKGRGSVSSAERHDDACENRNVESDTIDLPMSPDLFSRPLHSSMLHRRCRKSRNRINKTSSGPELNEKMHFGGPAGEVHRGRTGGLTSISSVSTMLKRSALDEETTGKLRGGNFKARKRQRS